MGYALSVNSLVTLIIDSFPCSIPLMSSEVPEALSIITTTLYAHPQTTESALFYL